HTGDGDGGGGDGSGFAGAGGCRTAAADAYLIIDERAGGGDVDCRGYVRVEGSNSEGITTRAGGTGHGTCPSGPGQVEEGDAGGHGLGDDDGAAGSGGADEVADGDRVSGAGLSLKKNARMSGTEGEGGPRWDGCRPTTGLNPSSAEPAIV